MDRDGCATPRLGGFRALHRVPVSWDPERGEDADDDECGKGDDSAVHGATIRPDVRADQHYLRCEISRPCSARLRWLDVS